MGKEKLEKVWGKKDVLGEEIKELEEEKNGWIMVVIAVIGLLMIICSLSKMPPIITESMIADRVDKVEEVSYPTYDVIKKKFNIVGNENVDITYSEDGNTITVKEDDYYQEYVVDRNKEVTEEESDRELEQYLEIRTFVYQHRTMWYIIPFLVVTVPSFVSIGWLGFKQTRISKKGVK